MGWADNLKPRAEIEWGVFDAARGKTLLASPGTFAGGVTYADAGRACIELMSGVERCRHFLALRSSPEPTFNPEYAAPVIGDRSKFAGGPLLDAFDAASMAVRLIVGTSHRRDEKASMLPPFDVPAAGWMIPVVILGAAAVAGITYWGVDRNEKWLQVEAHAAELAAQVDMYVQQVNGAIVAGKPIPPPTPPVQRAASAQRATLPIVGVGAALVGGAIVYGVLRWRPERRANPRRIGRPRRIFRRRPNAARAPEITTATVVNPSSLGAVATALPNPAPRRRRKRKTIVRRRRRVAVRRRSPATRVVARLKRSTRRVAKKAKRASRKVARKVRATARKVGRTVKRKRTPKKGRRRVAKKAKRRR